MDGVTAPDLHKAGELRHGDQASGGLALAVAHVARRHDMTTPQYDLAGEVLTQARTVQALEQEQEAHPAHRWGDRKQLKKHRRRMEELEQEIEERQRFAAPSLQPATGKPSWLCSRFFSSSAALMSFSPLRSGGPWRPCAVTTSFGLDWP